MKKIILLMYFAMLSCMAVWASATFNAKKASTTPTGAGSIYYYHPKGGVLVTDGNYKNISAAPNDVLPTSITDAQWKELTNSSVNAAGDEIELDNSEGKYCGEGFRFLGWKKDETGDYIEGNNKVYPLKGSEAEKKNGSVYKIWNNDLINLPQNSTEGHATSGTYQAGTVSYHYLRHVELITNGDNKTINYYAYFEMIPQTFSFGGTGNGATYTASSSSFSSTYNVGTEDMAGVSEETAKSIILTLNSNSYDRALYKFAGWYYDYTDQSGRHTQNLLSTSMTATYKLSSTEAADATWNKKVATWSNVKIYPLFVDLRFANFCVGLTGCQTLEQAIAAVADSDDKTILVIKNYTVPEGNYTIPEGVTLLIPYAIDQESPATVLPRVENQNATAGNAYRTLTLSSGVHLDVYGTIEVGGRQATGTSGAGGEDGIGCPTGGYGCLYMSAGSSITLNNGALLRGWGYVLGDFMTVNDTLKYQCEIDARRGSRVQEQFQMMDWKGGTYTMGMTQGINSYPGEKQVLPVNQYYIQNVEVPVKYRPGSKLQANASVFLNGTFSGIPLNNVTLNIDNVGVIGARYNDSNVKDDEAIFLMDNEDDSEDTWVRKYYDVANDKQVYEINNAASLGSLVLTIIGIPVSSTEYKLPITNNFKIHLLNGAMDVTQRTEILPGAEIEIDKEAALAIPENVTLYLWDKDDWGNFVSTTRNPNSTFTFGKATTVKWRPGGRPDVRRDNEGKVILSDAKLTLHGSANITGYLKTTTHGTSITSTLADAGTVTFTNSTPKDADAGKVWQVQSLPADNDNPGGFIGINCTSAQLMNEDDTFTETADKTATENNPISFCFLDFDGDGKGEWKALATNGCFVKDENNVYYIKPKEYVAISQDAAPVEEADHTYRDHYAGTGRIFIQAAEGDCQWWEVRAVSGHPDLFECINENNHTFYYYDESVGNWMEKKFKVSWVNWDGTPVNYTNKEDQQVNYYMVTYGTVPEWLSANPKHVEDASHTYSLKGWLPTPAAVTEDVTYTAQYEERDRMYAITFNDEGDKLIQLVYCKLGEIPVCTNYDAAANNKVWKTASGEAIGAVAGDVTYKLFAKETKANYTIRFVNWNGVQIGDAQSVPAGDEPIVPTNPTKASDGLHSYSFKEWNPAVVAATEDATYTATYEVGPRGYTVLWKNGETTLETDENVPYGTVPEYNSATPAKAGFTFIGWSPAVAAVTGNATYTAQFMENRTISTAQTLTTNTEVSTITVETSGALTINDQVTLTAENLILKGGSNASGQLIPVTNKSKINATNAYYDLTLGAPQARHWNAFGVPWVVNLDLTPLIELNADGEPVGTLALGRDYDIVVYNGATRASQGPGYWCWEFLEHHVHNLTPGKGYMIQFIKDVKGIRFTKVSGTDFFYKGDVHLDENGSTNTDNAGWAAMANPMPFHATMTNGPTVGYVHNGGEIGNDGYVKYNLAGGKFIVGKTVYVQAGEGGDNVTPVLADGEVGPIVAAAPARRTNATDKKYMALEDYYTVVISDAAGNKGGDICVLPEEEKENKYVIGHDLAHFGMSAAIPQIWVNRYDTKLALNTTALVGETAEFPMGVYAPAAGEYTISLNAQPSEDYTVYLTRDGQVIWNLSDGAFVTTLTSGIQSNYGVRLVRKAPQVATGIDEAVVDAKNETRKVLIDNQVFIIREGHVYTVDGQIVK